MTAVLRAVLAVIFAIGIVNSIADIVAPSPQVSAFTYDMTPLRGERDTYRLDALRGLTVRDGDARQGDVLQLLDPTPAERLLVVAPGTPVRFTDRRTGTPVTLIDTLPRAPAVLPWKLLRVAIEVTALVLLLLRGTMVPVIGLTTFLFCNQFTTAAMTGSFLGVWWRVAYKIVQSPLSVSVAAIGLIVLAAGFSPPSRRQRIVVMLLVSLGIAWIAVDLGVSTWNLLGGRFVDSALADRLMVVVLTAGVLGLFVRAALRTHGIERRRVVLLALAIALGVSGDLYGFFGPSVYNPVQSALNVASTTLMTIGLAYAILVEHLFDIGFVVNRAVVFAIISAIILPVFVLIEIALGSQAEQFGGTVGTRTLGVAMAVLIGVLLRPLHRSVDSFADRVLFAARHRNANAILSFADDCDDIPNRERLLQRTVEAVQRFAGVAGCAVLIADDHGNLHEAISANLHVEPLERDSLVLLRLRNSRRPLRRGAGSPLDVADVAFPIPGKQRLAGAILCVRPRRAEPYSPEEFDALHKLAHSVGTALLAIDAAEARHLRGELATLRERARRSAHRPHR